MISQCQGKGSSQVSGSARVGGDIQLKKELYLMMILVSAWRPLISKASEKISIGNDRAKEIVAERLSVILRNWGEMSILSSSNPDGLNMPAITTMMYVSAAGLLSPVASTVKV